jgi:protocatechuate 3,4-dioxygenase beta subunit
MRRAIVVALLLAGCGGSTQPVERAARTCEPTHGHPESVVSSPEGSSSRARMGPGMELEATKRNLAAARIGKPMVVTGVVRGTDCKPLAGATVHAWQTNGAGRYGPTRNGQDLCCYLQASVRTDEQGRYTLDTVMPKGYAGGRAHIHFQAGHPDTQGVTSELVLLEPAASVDYDIVLRDR